MALGLDLVALTVSTLESFLPPLPLKLILEITLDVVDHLTSDAEGHPAVIHRFSLHVILYFAEIIVFVVHHFL